MSLRVAAYATTGVTLRSIAIQPSALAAAHCVRSGKSQFVASSFSGFRQTFVFVRCWGGFGPQFGMDATELQRRIRRKRRQRPVIFITAYDDDDIREHALRDGAVASTLLSQFEARESWRQGERPQ
jgi:hypothetical protein